MNVYDAVQDLRELLGEAEASAVHWSKRLVLSTLCRINLRYYIKMSMTLNDWFVKKSAALTPSSQEITIPVDCAKPIYMEEVASRNEVPLDLSIRDKSRTELVESAFSYYNNPRAFVLRDTIFVNKVNYDKQVYLWYDQRCQNLHTGTAAAGGANSLTLEDSLGHSLIDDYYNGLDIAIVSGTGAGTVAEITDYDGGTRVCTVSGTFGSDSVYGMISVLPDEAYDAWITRCYATLLSKAAGIVGDDFLRAARADAKLAEEDFYDWVHTRVKNTIRIPNAEGM